MIIEFRQNDATVIADYEHCVSANLFLLLAMMCKIGVMLYGSFSPAKWSAVFSRIFENCVIRSQESL